MVISYDTYIELNNRVQGTRHKVSGPLTRDVQQIQKEIVNEQLHL